MFIEFRGHQVHAVSYGRGDLPVVGISGAIGTCEIWEPPFELLSVRHQVIAYDHLGVGSTHVPANEVTFENQTDLVEAVLDAFAVERCVLVGDSNMVAVAIEAAGRWPGRVSALALVAGGLVHRPEDTVVRFVAGLRHNFEATVDAFVALCIPEADSAHLRPRLRDIIVRTGGERAAILLESFYGVDVSDRLADLKMPTAVIHGDKDALPTSAPIVARQIAADVADGRLELLAGAGHVPTLTRPVQVGQIIQSLIEEVRE